MLTINPSKLKRKKLLGPPHHPQILPCYSETFVFVIKFVAIWIDLEDIMLREILQNRKTSTT
jgi:hypothetical protein